LVLNQLKLNSNADKLSALLNGLFPHPAGEAVNVDDGAFVQAAHGLWAGWRLI